MPKLSRSRNKRGMTFFTITCQAACLAQELGNNNFSVHLVTKCCNQFYVLSSFLSFPPLFTFLCPFLFPSLFCISFLSSPLPPSLSSLFQGLHNRSRSESIQSRCRFIKEEHRRVCDQLHADVRAPPLSSGHPANQLRADLRQQERVLVLDSACDQFQSKSFCRENSTNSNDQKF